MNTFLNLARDLFIAGVLAWTLILYLGYLARVEGHRISSRWLRAIAVCLLCACIYFYYWLDLRMIASFIALGALLIDTGFIEKAGTNFKVRKTGKAWQRRGDNGP